MKAQSIVPDPLPVCPVCYAWHFQRLFVFRATLAARSEQLGGNKYLLADGLFIAKMLGRTLIEYPAKDAR